jgi:hypothetical protein
MTQKNISINERGHEDMIRQVENLTEQVKTLALNLALTLAREKKQIKDLTLLEPEFTKLVNGSVDVIREISEILRALQSDKIPDSSTTIEGKNLARIEASLNEILTLSQNVLKAVASIKNGKKKVDKYK